MDIISFNEASTANGRIENFIENPDSTSGIVTVPKVIATGESVTIPAGRVAVLPNVKVDGTVNILGEVFVPSGSTYGDLDTKIALKADTTYVDAQVATRGRLVQGTAVNSTSGTSIDFTGIPSWAKRITVMFSGISLSALDSICVRVGTPTIESTGYSGAVTSIGLGNTYNTTNLSSSFLTSLSVVAASDSVSGTFELNNLGGNVWIAKSITGDSSAAYNHFMGGTKTTSSALNTIRITTCTGTSTFDAGQINIMYEG